jgi:hypothetical protein
MRGIKVLILSRNVKLISYASRVKDVTMSRFLNARIDSGDTRAEMFRW